MSIVVGIDTSSKGFHVCSSEPIFMSARTLGSRLNWVLPPGDAQLRREGAFRGARRMFELLPDGAVVVIEEPLILPKNIDTTMKLVMMAGVIEGAFWQACPDAILWWVNVSTWRRQVLNPPKGYAPRNKDGWKALARQYVLDRADSLWPYSTEELATMEDQPDFWDAACICAYGRTLSMEVAS